MFCPECGKGVEVGTVFCPECGAKVDKRDVSPIGQPVKAIETKGFFASLFDFSFSEFITSKIIKFLYILSIIVIVLLALAVIIICFKKSKGTGIAALVFSPLIFLLFVILDRIWLEMMIVIFRIAEHVRDIAQQKRRES